MASAAMARFPNVASPAGHYESYYIKASHPTRPLAVWIRHTAHKRPHEPALGSVWFTLFDGESKSGPRAAKVTLGPDQLGTGTDHYIHVGETRLAPGHATGSVQAPGCRAAWDLSFAGDEEPFLHLPRDWMYSAALPRTKAVSLHPGVRFTGQVDVDGDRTVLDAWPGMIGHNWGAEHAARWIWLHGTNFREQPDAWLDVTIGRVRLGPLNLPWIANGCLRLDGVRHRLGGLKSIRATRVREAPTACDFALRGPGIAVRGNVRAARDDFVGWVYADPGGGEHHVGNCSIADLDVTVSRTGRPDADLTVQAGAAYELGLPVGEHGVDIQPFSDP